MFALALYSKGYFAEKGKDEGIYVVSAAIVTVTTVTVEVYQNAKLVERLWAEMGADQEQFSCLGSSFDEGDFLLEKHITYYSDDDLLFKHIQLVETINHWQQ